VSRAPTNAPDVTLSYNRALVYLSLAH